MGRNSSIAGDLILLWKGECHHRLAGGDGDVPVVCWRSAMPGCPFLDRAQQRGCVQARSGPRCSPDTTGLRRTPGSEVVKAGPRAVRRGLSIVPAAHSRTGPVALFCWVLAGDGAGAHVAVQVGPGIAGSPKNQIRIRIIRAGDPGGHSATPRCLTAPCIAARLRSSAGTWEPN